ncbi:MAG: alanine racemase C-terminal domain-containing protein, partial [bacterium]
EIKKGDKVGYSGVFEANENMRIAILPVGYNDGVNRRLSNIGVVKVKNEYFKILGRVSMNVTTIDITNILNVNKGDEVEIFSEENNDQNSILNVSKLCSTIPYDLLVHINPYTRREIRL